MNITIKIKTFPNPTETFVVNHINQLIENGYNVKIFCNTFLGISNYPKDNSEKFNEIKKIFYPTQTKGNYKKLFLLLLISINLRRIYYILKYYIYFPQSSFQPFYDVFNYKDFEKEGLCHIQFNNSLKPIEILTKIGYINPKSIITFHGYDAFLETKEGFYKKYGCFYKTNVKAVTVNSNYLKQQLLKIGIDKGLIHIIPIGVNTKFYKSSPKKIIDKKIIHLITVGRLIQLKGHIYGLEVVKILKTKGVAVKYTIVGTGLDEFVNELKIKTKKLNIENEVQFVGFKNQVEIKDLLDKADIFLMTSTYDERTGREEAFGLTSIEAQAMGLPVIGFKSGGVPDTIDDAKTGCIVKDRDAEEMSKKIIELCQDKNKYHQMSKNAIKRVNKQFDETIIIKKYIDIYNS